MKVEFGKQIQVDLLIKNTDGSDRVYQESINSIDRYVPQKYNRNTLTQALENL